MSKSHYIRLLLMAALSFVAMYVLMYAMVNTVANVHLNFNQLYMAGLMTAPMVIIEIAVMGRMYQDRRLNAGIIGASLVAGALCWTSIRQQVAIDDKQFLRSMIPHHAGAILMCGEADVEDPELRQLCRTIISSQQSEIDQMKAKLTELSR